MNFAPWQKLEEKTATGFPEMAERLALLNSSQIQGKLDRSPVLQALLRKQQPAPQLITEMYFAILSRPPVDAELQAAGTRLRESREIELRTLIAPETREALDRAGIQLITYRDLWP